MHQSGGAKEGTDLILVPISILVEMWSRHPHQGRILHNDSYFLKENNESTNRVDSFNLYNDKSSIESDLWRYKFFQIYILRCSNLKEYH